MGTRLNLTVTRPLAAAAAFLAACLAPSPALPQKPASGVVSRAEAEKRLLQADYLGSLQAAHWAVKQGPRAVPALDALLARTDAYRKRADGTGAFPFNALWALAHIPGEPSRAALQRFRKAARGQTDREMADLALKGHALRATRKSSRYGVLGGAGTTLYAVPSEQAKALRELRPRSGGADTAGAR
jgi:hypothetical protein